MRTWRISKVMLGIRRCCGRRPAVGAVGNLEPIRLLCAMRPDFRPIADFRCNDRTASKAVFQGCVALCRELDLVGGELLAVDGTRLRAVNSRSRKLSRERLRHRSHCQP